MSTEKSTKTLAELLEEAGIPDMTGNLGPGEFMIKSEPVNEAQALAWAKEAEFHKAQREKYHPTK